jgi:hypothetical protein
MPGCHPRGFEVLDWIGKWGPRNGGLRLGRGEAIDVPGFSSSSLAALASCPEQISDVTISFATAFEE